MTMVQHGSDALNRPNDLPVDAVCYWQSGELDQHSLPAGLTREHWLKEGTWGLLTLLSGSIGFNWDDADGGTVELSAPARMVIPPTIRHHVDKRGSFTLQIEFYRQA
jgi:tellurite resistance-related uncharacterized protein